MSSTSVSEKILAEAKEQADKILAKANVQVGQIQDQGQKETGSLDKQIQAEADQAALQEQHRILAKARQEVTARILQTKHEVLEKVFRAVEEALAKMPADEYRKLLARMLEQAVVSGNEIVVPAEKEKHLNQQLLDQVAAKLGKSGKLKLSDKKIPGRGGFILFEQKASTKVTWEVLLSQARRELQPQLSKMLFADSQAGQ